MSDQLAPPPRRAAPDALRRRIEQELRQAPQPGRRRQTLRMIVPIAAATVLVAGIGGTTAIRNLHHQHDIVVTPAASPRATTTTSPPDRSTEPGATRPMSEAEIAHDTKTCTAPDPSAAMPIPRKGTAKAIYATVQPPIGNRTEPTSHRILFVADEQGTFSCIDGRQRFWSDHGQDDDNRASPDAAAVVDPAGDSGSSQTCGPDHPARVDTQALLQIKKSRAEQARVKINSGGRPVIEPTAVPIRDGWIFVPIEMTGAAARKQLMITVEVLDAAGDRLPIQPYAPGDTQTVKKLTLSVERCQ
ncbi:hypothetical protein [Microlunatus soli]|uniref:Uncharacterized protein n=1 Tax=Microlunatus soli TaxID=630515 RepID=A0A1H1URP8_9ACTN|nr:hypothetical protein [Microlunatus soli]SDS75127.1 hypothetical protein SAMN04489812_2904 [Microlunatus soli]